MKFVIDQKRTGTYKRLVDATIDEILVDNIDNPEFHVARDRVSERDYEWHLAIWRDDRKPIGDWRMLQDIKNAVAGADRSAIQVFPPEREVVDTANVYHLWVCFEGSGPGVYLIPSSSR